MSGGPRGPHSIRLMDLCINIIQNIFSGGTVKKASCAKIFFLSSETFPQSVFLGRGGANFLTLLSHYRLPISGNIQYSPRPAPPTKNGLGPRYFDSFPQGIYSTIYGHPLRTENQEQHQHQEQHQQQYSYPSDDHYHHQYHHSHDCQRTHHQQPKYHKLYLYMQHE